MTVCDEGQVFEKEVNSLLIGLRHKRVKRRVFRFDVNTDTIEHYLYLHRGTAGQRNLFNVDFGIREPIADKFGVYCIKKFGILAAKEMKYEEKYDCLFRFSVSMLTKSKSNFFDMERGVEKELARFKEIVLNYAISEIESINSIQSFYDLLVSDSEDGWHTWTFSDAAVRSAIATAIGKTIGLSDDVVKLHLKPYNIKILNSCVQALTPEKYMSSILKEWGRFNAEANRRN